MVIGIVIRNNDRYQDVMGVLEPDDFYNVFNRYCWEAIGELFQGGDPIDQVSIWEIVRKKYEDKSSLSNMLEFTENNVFTTVNIGNWAKIIKENSGVRKLIAQTEVLKNVLYEYKSVDEIGTAVDVISSHSSDVFSGNMPKSIYEIGDDVIEEYESVVRGDRGIPYPWETLNKFTGGMRIGNLSLWVGRPNVGKSFTLTLLGYFAHKNDWPVLIISPEMDRVEIAERYFPIELGVSYSRVAYGKLSSPELSKLKTGVDELKGKTGLWIMDSTDDITPGGIESAVRATGAKLVVIDSLYKLKLRGERRDKAIAAIEWACPATKRLGVHIACFAQQNRDAEKSARMGGGSRMGTIALADELAQDSDMIFAIEQNKDEKKDKILRIRPLKLRKGYYADEPLKINWDWVDMKYDEIEKDDEYDSDGAVNF